MPTITISMMSSSLFELNKNISFATNNDFPFLKHVLGLTLCEYIISGAECIGKTDKKKLNEKHSGSQL